MTALTASPQHLSHLQCPLGSVVDPRAGPSRLHHTLSSTTPLETSSAIDETRPTTAASPQRDFICPYPECGKLFIKASKFEDHKRSHTGERPFACEIPTCGKSFTRKDHLQRHARSHQSTSTSTAQEEGSEQRRPFLCTVRPAGETKPCGRRFLTQQHLTRHVREFHDLSSTADEGAGTATDVESKGKRRRRGRKGGDGAYPCEIAGCTETFNKRKHVRAHVIARHSDFGASLTDVDQEEAERIARLPYPCTHEGCQKRFATNSKRNAHARSHEDKTKYMCALTHDTKGSSIIYFSTWTELQQHQREAHPPTCSWPGCGKTFANLQNLRHHTSRHQERESPASVLEDDAEASDASSEVEGNTIRPQRETFACNWVPADEEVSADCTKTFRSKYARDVHIKNQHLGLQEFACPDDGCEKRYGNKRSLNRHVAKCHKEVTDGQSGDDESEKEDEEVLELDDDFFREEGGAVPESFSERQPARKRAREAESSDLRGLLSSLTGSGYGEASASKKRRMRGRVVTCPWDKICLLRDGEHIKACDFRFSRLYDVQRHLEAIHGIALTQVDISSLIGEEEGSRLATPRPSASREINTSIEIAHEGEGETSE